jgi:DNA-binding Lrp family transcriptional regulator
MTLGQREMIILSQFRRNARQTLTELSRTTNIPVSTIYDKLKVYESSIIKRYTALVDFSKLGYDIRVNISIKAEPCAKKQLTNFIINNLNVNSVYRINSGYDFMVEALFRDMKEMQVFLDELDRIGVKERNEYFISEDLKREAFLAKPEYIDLI